MSLDKHKGDPGIKEMGPDSERETPAYNGMSRSRAESFLAFERQMRVGKLPSPYFTVSKVFMGV